MSTNLISKKKRLSGEHTCLLKDNTLAQKIRRQQTSTLQVHIRAAGDVQKRVRGGDQTVRKLPKGLLVKMVRIRLENEVIMMMVVVVVMMTRL